MEEQCIGLNCSPLSPRSVLLFTLPLPCTSVQSFRTSLCNGNWGGVLKYQKPIYSHFRSCLSRKGKLQLNTFSASVISTYLHREYDVQKRRRWFRKRNADGKGTKRVRPDAKTYQKQVMRRLLCMKRTEFKLHNMTALQFMAYSA